MVLKIDKKFTHRDSTRTGDLLSFTPKVIKDDNEYYVGQLKRVVGFTDTENNNIAVEGDYGTGKSSILKQFKENASPIQKFRSKTISFLSFSMAEQGSNGDNSLPVVLRKEIIKQLFYGENPNRLKGSGYKRLGRIYWLLPLTVSCFLAFIGVNILRNIEISTGFNDLISGNYHYGYKTVLAFFFMIICFFFLCNQFLNSLFSGEIKRFTLEKFSVELDNDRLDSDKIMDLLLLYFRKSGKRIIIFEDIDRLNNIEIFEELRQLNITLNNRMKIFGKIKFIYAIKENMFDPLGNNAVKSYSIKTKIFDYIIPVVPFLSAINVEEKIKDELSATGINIADVGVLANIIGKQISDMRTIKYIINCYIVYAQMPNFSVRDDSKNCIALAIMRAIYPTEFNAISVCESILDKIRDAGFEEKGKARTEIIDRYTLSGIIKTNSEKIWNEMKMIKGISESVLLPNTVEIDGVISPTVETDILEKIYRCESEIRIWWAGQVCDYDKALITKLFEKVIKDEIVNKEKNKENSLKRAIARDVFSYYKNMTVLVNETKEKFPLIHDLIENDFIDSGYVKYISRVSFNQGKTDEAHRFIYSCVRKGTMKESYYLDKDTLLAVLSNIDDTDLASIGMYNFSLFDYLLSEYKTDFEISKQMNEILNSVKLNLDEFKLFFGRYLDAHKSSVNILNPANLNSANDKLVMAEDPLIFLMKLLAKKYPEESIGIISTLDDVGDTTRNILYNIITLNLDTPSSVEIDSTGLELLDKYADSIARNEGGKDVLFSIYLKNSVYIDSLSSLSVNNEKIKNNIGNIKFKINKDNLKLVNDENMIAYAAINRFDSDDFCEIFKYAKKGFKEYVVMNLFDLLPDNPSSDLYKLAITSAIKMNTKLSFETVKKYSSKINRKFLIRAMNRVDLSVEEIVDIFMASGDRQLEKIKESNKQIWLDNDAENSELAERLEGLGMVQILKSNSATVTEHIKMKVL